MLEKWAILSETSSGFFEENPQLAKKSYLPNDTISTEKVDPRSDSLPATAIIVLAFPTYDHNWYFFRSQFRTFPLLPTILSKTDAYQKPKSNFEQDLKLERHHLLDRNVLIK